MGLRHWLAPRRSVCEANGSWTVVPPSMCPERTLFKNYRSLKVTRPVTTSDGHRMDAVGEGDIEVLAYNGKRWETRVMYNTLHVPTSAFNLFSMSAALDKGCDVQASADGVNFIRRGEVVTRGVRMDVLFHMMIKTRECLALAAIPGVSLEEWHRRMAHQNLAHVKKVLKLHGVPIVGEEKQCVSCLAGKAARSSFPTRKVRSVSVGETVHVDLSGPLEVESIAGARYMFLIKDEFSHYRGV